MWNSHECWCSETVLVFGWCWLIKNRKAQLVIKSMSFCCTSGAAFLLWSVWFSTVRLASKHSGQTLLVLLSEVFEHFAQMACGLTQKWGKEKKKTIIIIFPSKVYNRLIFSICAYRSTRFAVVLSLGEIKALIAAFARLFFFLFFLWGFL